VKLIKSLKMAALSTALIAGSVMADMPAKFSPQQQKAIESIVRDYLVKNPEILVEVSQALQQKQRSEMMNQAKTAIDGNAKALFSAKSPTIGNAKGNVTLIEFFDYQCGHCKKMAPVLSQLVKNDSNLRVIYKDFPIFGKSSDVAARAALAAQKQGKYKALHDKLINAKQRLSTQIVMQAAKSAGLDVTKLKKDMESPEIKAELKANMQLAEKLRLMGTPAFIIASTPNGQFKAGGKSFFVPGAASEEALQDLIKQAGGNS